MSTIGVYDALRAAGIEDGKARKGPRRSASG